MYEDAEVAPDGSNARLKPHAQVHLLSPTDKCKVCNEPAAKHVHYGAMTCFSCRAFFRRSIQNKTAATYVCRRSRNCEINLRTRKNCQFCRYAKCISAGMKPSWVLSEGERQRRFRKNRERGGQEGQDQPPHPGQVVSSHKKERNSQSSSSELPLESIDEALLASMMEQQQNQQQTFVVKTEPRVQQVSPPILEQKREPEIVKTESKPGSFVSTAGQQYLVKTESGDGSFILAAPMASSQQSTILVYTALPQHPHPPPQVHQSSGASAVIVPRTEAAPRTLISNIGVSGVTITPASSGSGAPVTTIKQSCFEKTKKPAAASYQVPSSSVIVQSPQRQQQPQFAAASNRFGGSSASVATNFVLKQENQQQQIPLIFTPSSSNSGSSKPVA